MQYSSDVYISLGAHIFIAENENNKCKVRLMYATMYI